MLMPRHAPHPEVPHPRELLSVNQINGIIMDRIAKIFGSPWTVYTFMTVPLFAEYVATAIQSTVFFFSSAWVQLFALPLFVYQSNKRDKLGDAKADTDHMALTHIAHTVDSIVAQKDIHD